MYDQFGAAAFEQGVPGGFRGGGPFGGFGGAESGQYGPFTYTYTTSGNAGDFDFGGFSDPFEIFEQFFGFQSPFSRGGRRQQRRDVYEITLTFEEAVNGVKKTMIVKGEEKSFQIPAGVDDKMTIRFSDFKTTTRSLTLRSATDSLKTLKFEAMKLISPFLDVRENPERKPVRLVGGRIEKLGVKERGHNLSLFDR